MTTSRRKYRDNAPLRGLVDLVTVTEEDHQRYLDAGYRLLQRGETLTVERKPSGDGWVTVRVGLVVLGLPGGVEPLPHQR